MASSRSPLSLGALAPARVRIHNCFVIGFFFLNSFLYRYFEYFFFLQKYVLMFSILVVACSR